MTMLRHPLSRTEYYGDDDGTVTVRSANGKSGRFTRHGLWISGERRTADPAMCQWVSDGAVRKAKGLSMSLLRRSTEEEKESDAN